MDKTSFPATQYAVQLVGPGKVVLNDRKPVLPPGPCQLLAKVECVCLCFSDLKLLKQFHDHPRKSEITSGITPGTLAEIPSYVPGNKPTVPGHEVVVRIVATGNNVKHHQVGERCLVQADYRHLLTKGSNAAFGYDFEGGLQEYVIMDERVVMDPVTGERLLIPVSEGLGASAIALIEPWACVENSYVTAERQTIKAGGKLAVVIDPGYVPQGISASFPTQGKPASLTFAGKVTPPSSITGLGIPMTCVDTPDELETEGYDDILYFGHNRETIEILNDKLAACGIINLITGGKAIGEPVAVGVGRVHYGMTRWIGTISSNAAESYAAIPKTGEIRNGDTICSVGAGGPMGQMHVIRNVCSGHKAVKMIAVDFDDARLSSLMDKAIPMARNNDVSLTSLNPRKAPLKGPFSYNIVMAPAGALVADAITHSAARCLINIFAGIPAATRQAIDLDLYIRNHCFMFGTSGSTIQDMKIVLEKVATGKLDTNSSVDAVSGMAGAIDGLSAVDARSLAGKICVYPSLTNLPLTPLDQLSRTLPEVAQALNHGGWTREAEQQLLKQH